MTNEKWHLTNRLARANKYMIAIFDHKEVERLPKDNDTAARHVQ